MVLVFDFYMLWITTVRSVNKTYNFRERYVEIDNLYLENFRNQIGLTGEKICLL